jgi:hypothetical protein
MNTCNTGRACVGTRKSSRIWIGTLALAGSAVATAADGEFDNSFGLAGTVNHVEVAPVDVDAQARHRVSSQVFPDGTVAISGTRPHRVSKFLLNGDPDPDFGVGGTTPVLAGDLGDAGTNFLRTGEGTVFTLARKKDGPAAGAVVCRFGPDGLPQNFQASATPCVEHMLEDSEGYWPQDIAVDPLGGLVVAGRDGRMVRFNADGSVDATIGSNGVYQVQPASTNDLFHTIEDMELAGNAIYLAGWIDNDMGQVDGVVHKLELQGGGPIERDPQFAGGEPLLVDCGGQLTSLCQLRALARIGGDLVVAGSGQHDALYGIVFQLDGASGEQQGPMSVLPMSATPGTRVELNAIAAQANGDVVVAGTLRSDPDAVLYDQVVVARLGPACNNPVDPGFSTSGWMAFTYAVDAYAEGTSIAIGDHRVYVAGHTHWNVPIMESVSALVNSEATSDGIFADDFELPCIN